MRFRLAVPCAWLVAACATPDDRLVGEWRFDSEPDRTMIFRSDGTYGGTGVAAPGSYRVLDANRLELQDPTGLDTAVFGYAGARLYLSEGNADTLWLSRLSDTRLDEEQLHGTWLARADDGSFLELHFESTDYEIFVHQATAAKDFTIAGRYAIDGSAIHFAHPVNAIRGTVVDRNTLHVQIDRTEWVFTRER